jgi:pimeloyl-ACP methyl ester carboxylesterase
VILPFDEAGTGPAVVLLHAGVADRRMWAGHLEPLAAAGLRAIAPDLPGFGETPEPPGEQAPWREVLATMDAAGVETAALVGDSLGGAVALRVALVAPTRVRALVLCSAQAPGHEPSPSLRAAWAAEEEAVERDDLDGAVAAVVAAWTQPDAPAALRDYVADAQRRALTLQLAAGDVDEAEDPAEAGPGALGGLDVPTLVVVGEHDMVDYHRSADTLAAAIPGASRVVLPGAGHLAPLETPEAFRSLVLDFLPAA